MKGLVRSFYLIMWLRSDNNFFAGERVLLGKSDQIKIGYLRERIKVRKESLLDVCRNVPKIFMVINITNLNCVKIALIHSVLGCYFHGSPVPLVPAFSIENVIKDIAA